MKETIGQIIPFVDLKAQYNAYKTDIDLAISEILQSARFIGGPIVQELESELATYTGSAHCVSCASGTDALILSLLSIGLSPGNEVITTPFTFFSTVEAICVLGGIPIFVDIEEDTYNIDAQLIEERVTERTRAIIPVSIFGQPADMDVINQIADSHSLWVIEDAAQSFGATYRDDKSCHLSPVGCTSFFPSKPLGCYGDGGAVFTDSEELATRLAELRNHGSAATHVHNSIGLNARLDAVQAAVLKVKLRHLESEIKRRRIAAATYDEELGGTDLATIPYMHSDRTSVYAQYSVRTEARSDLMRKLSEIGIPTVVHYPKPLYRQEALTKYSYDSAEYPVVECVCREILSLPICAFLTPENQERVISGIKASLV